MVAIRVSPFGGMVPAVDDRLLPDINGALSQDTWLYAGTAVGLPAPKTIRTLTNSAAAKVYRIPNNYTDSFHLTDSIWMEFASADTDVVRSLVVGDTFDRFYWVSPIDVPRYAPKANIVTGAPAMANAYMLGVPPPGTITAVPSGGSSGTLKSVAYVQTFVSAYGEEGPPSVPVNLTGVKIDATVTVTLHAADPLDLGTNRNLTKSRIYRTIVGSNGTATFFFVAEMAIGTTTYADNASVATDAVVALNAGLSSTTWTGPPTDLQGMVSLANGMIVGFRKNELWFCEPFRAHAWPAAYTLVTEYPIVGLGVSSQMLVVATQGFAYTATGINPSSVSLVKLPGLLPCTSRGSIVGTTDGVYFSTPGGLALVTPGGVVIATKELVRKDKWNALVATSTLRAAQLGPAYYAFGQARFGVFDVNSFDPLSFAQSDFSGARRGLLIDPTSHSVAFNLLASADPVTNIQTDAWSSEVFIVRNGLVQWLDIGDTLQTRAPFTWRSKIFQPALKKNFQAMKIYFNSTPTWPVSYVQDPIVPVMTAQVTSGVTMTADTVDTAGTEPWRAASGAPGDCWRSDAGALPHYLITNFGTPKTISSYSIGCITTTRAALGDALKTWSIQGSNDGVTYATLDTQTNAPAFVNGEVRSYPIAAPAAYTYYRVKCTTLQGGGTNAAIANFQLSQAVFGTFKAYADNKLVMRRNMVTSGEQWRMPSGFKADFWQFEFNSGVEILSAQFATSPVELQAV